MAKTPIKITLYDPETGEVTKEFIQMFVPWRLLKSAVDLANMDTNNIKPEDIEKITTLVVDTFGGRFTADELENGADISEMLTVVRQIVTKAGNANPTPPVQ